MTYQYPQRVKSRIKDVRPRGITLQAADRQQPKPPRVSAFIGQLGGKSR